MKGCILLISVLAVSVWNEAVVLSCSCNIDTHGNDFRKAKAIFIGKVVAVNFNADGPGELIYSIKLKIEKAWKGSNKSEITLLSNNGFGACQGFEFEVGEKYLVYAFAFKNQLETYTFCSRSRPLSRVNEITEKEINQLNSFWFRFKARLWLS